MDPIRVVLADDHTLVRSGIRALLERFDDVEMVGEAANGREALELVEKHRPDIVLMDIAMPELNGLEAARRIHQLFPTTRVLLLSMYDNEEYVAEALAIGAAGYVLKDASAAELDIAVHAVARGESYLSPAVAKRIVEGQVPPGGEGAVGLQRLTPRQREILQLIAEGNSSKEIARKLELSVKTVETHRTQLMERLDIHDIAGLVRYAIRVGLVKPE
jgi:DNA-binding NarL/FixJ family response regulator